MNRVVSSREQRLQAGPPASPLVGFDRLWVELKQREARLASCCGQERDPTPTIFRDPSRLPKVSETMRKDPMPPPGPTPSVWLEYERRQAWEQARQAKAQEGDCACQEPKAKPRRAGPDANGVRQVSGEWLGRVLALPEETVQQIAGRDVRVGAEAWYAIQAVQESGPRWRRIRRDVAKRRARIWPRAQEEVPDNHPPGSYAMRTTAKGAADQPGTGQSSGAVSGCDCVIMGFDPGARFVDSVDGDDAWEGGWVLVPVEEIGGVATEYELVFRPWKTLWRAFFWLQGLAELSRGLLLCVEGAGVYLRRDRTWTGQEEGHDPNRWESPGLDRYRNATVCPLYDFKATADAPLTFGAYGEGATPILDGRIIPPTEPQYRDPRKAVIFYNCCHVQMCNWEIRGFGHAIGVTGACRDHLYFGLDLHDNAGGGIGFGSDEAYAAVELADRMDVKASTGAELAEGLIAYGLYPEEIIVHSCFIQRNGYDTGCQGIGLGFLATNCTLYGNRIAGDDVRGVDGITGNGASSGHLIEANTIWDHRKYCSGSSKEFELPYGETVTIPIGAEFHEDTTCSGADYELVARCSPLHPKLSCEPTDYGYVLTRPPPGDAIPDGKAEAFGEDGIDLKGVRPRTPTSELTTVICGNTIHGNGGFSGVSIADASRGIHIYRNRIYTNTVGVLVANGPSGGWYEDLHYYERRTREVYIYRNLIYMNRENGIKINSDYALPWDEDEAPEGVDVKALGMQDFDVEGVFVLHNTIAHNLWAGVRVAVEDSHSGSGEHIQQVHIVGNLFVRNDTRTVGMEWNAGFQVEWSQMTPDEGDCFMDCNVYVGWDDDNDFSNLAKVIAVGGNAYRLETFRGTYLAEGFEVGGQQTDDLTELDLEGEVDFLALATRKDQQDFVADALHSSTAYYLSYDIGAASICVGGGDWDYMDALYAEEGVSLDISTDIEGTLDVALLDVGAFSQREDT